jgi:APA family basic amino acid/polyamine antiporter
VFVSIGLAAGISGYWVMAAIAIAALLAIFNGLNSAQLAANHAVSGGAYEYGHVYLFPWAGFVAGWVFIAAKTASAATAAMGFAGYLAKAFNFSSEARVIIGLVAVVGITAIVSFGIRRSNQANTAIVAFTIIGLIIFCVAGYFYLNSPAAPAPESTDIDFDFSDLLQAAAIMFVAYTGYGRVATLGEEVKNPRHAIPRAIIATLVITALLYAAVGFVATMAAGPERYSQLSEETAAPLEIISADFGVPGLPIFMAVAATIAMLGVLLNLILGISRVVLSMSRRGDLPQFLSSVNQKNASPVNAILFTSAIIIGVLLINDLKFTWSFSAFTVLLYYAINNLAALAIPKQNKLFPAWVAIAGLIICAGLAWWVEVEAIVIGIIVIAIGVLWRIVYRLFIGPGKGANPLPTHNWLKPKSCENTGRHFWYFTKMIHYSCTCFFQSRYFACMGTLATFNDGTSMTEAGTFLGSFTTNIGDYRFCYLAFFDQLSKFFFLTAADLAKHDNSFGIGIFLEFESNIRMAPADDRVTAHMNNGCLPNALLVEII